MSEAFYTMVDAAKVKGVSYYTVSRAVRNGKLTANRIGRQAFIAEADLHAWRPMTQRAPRIHRRRTPDLSVEPTITGQVKA